MGARRRRGANIRPLLPRDPTARALLAIVLVAVLLIAWWMKTRRAAPPPANAPVNAALVGEIRIATWNLRQFSDRGKADLRAVAAIITDAGFDVVAIQEVKREGEQVDRLLNVLGPPWRGTIGPMTGNNERYAFIYRGDRVMLLAKATLLDNPGRVFDRAPGSATFRAGAFDFELLTVHLSYTDTARRTREAAALARIAPDLAVKQAEKDIIVLGDFNEMDPPKGNLGYFDALGWRRLNDAPTNLGSSEIYDNILIDPKYTREYAGKHGVERFDEVRFHNDDAAARDNVSDHRPAWAVFSTTGPDDD